MTLTAEILPMDAELVELEVIVAVRRDCQGRHELPPPCGRCR